MANPKGNEASLVKYKPKWRSGKTQTIRVPSAISDLVLEAAREIDVNGNQSLLQVINQLKEENKRLKAVNTVTSDTKTSDPAEVSSAPERARQIEENSQQRCDPGALKDTPSDKVSSPRECAPREQSPPKNEDSITDTSESQQFTDADLAELTGADRSTIGKIRRGQSKKSKYMDRLKDYQPSESGAYWIKRINTDTSA